MSTFELAALDIAGLLLLVGAIVVRLRRAAASARSDAREAQQLAKARLDALLVAEQAISESSVALAAAHARLDELERSLQKNSAETSQLRVTAQDFESKYTQYRELIEGIHRERDGWKSMYYRESAGHGVAQAMLFREVISLAQRLKNAGKNPKLTPELQAVVLDHRVEHAIPAWEALGERHAPMPEMGAGAGP